MTAPDKMTPAQVAMLSSGIALFVVAVGLLIHFAKKKRPFTPAIALFPFAIIMIGFSSFSHVKMPGVFEFDEQSASAFTANPQNPIADANYRQTLTKLDNWRSTNSGRALPPQVKLSLESTVSQLKSRNDLTPESRVALSHAMLILGETNQARTTLNSAVKGNPNLMRSIDPRLRLLLKPE